MIQIQDLLQKIQQELPISFTIRNQSSGNDSPGIHPLTTSEEALSAAIMPSSTDPDVLNNSNHSTDTEDTLTSLSPSAPLLSRSVDRIEFLSADTIFDRQTLYLMNDKPSVNDTTVQPSLTDYTGEATNLSCIEEATDCFLITHAFQPDLPMIQIVYSGEVSLSDLYQHIFKCLRFESRLQAEINHLYHTLYQGSGLEGLAQQLEEYLHYPISILDVSYNMLATSAQMKQIPFGIRSVDNTLLLDHQEIESLRRLNIESRIYGSQGAFFMKTEDHPDTSWIFAAIRINHVMTGYVAVCLPVDHKVTQHELRLTTVFADICSIEMQKHEFFIRRTGMQYENFLIELLEGHFSDVNLIASRLELLNHRFGQFFCIIVLDCTIPHDSSLFNEKQMSTLRNYYANCMSVVYKDRIVLFLNQDQPIQADAKFLAPLADFCRRNSMVAGVSQPFADILKIKDYYEQALTTLNLSDVSSRDEVLFFSTDALIPYLFSNCSYTGLQIGIHHHIYELRDYDEIHHTDFILTLRTYLACDRNAAKSAETLHVHRSTFFYRIKKIEELLDISITDSHLLFLYELSFHILDYLSR